MNNKSIDLQKIKNIHMVGIGGSGMFSIAKILLEKGFTVTGSDSTESETTQKVRSLGIKLSIGHGQKNISNSDLLVFSAAIKNDNPEIEYAKKMGIPCIERSVMLGIIMKKYENSVAIAGTHGKTSTSAIITHILLDCGKDPTALIGGTLPRINANSCTGKSDILVCEACEYVDSFLQLFPKISVVLNLEADHLDYFKTLEGIKNSFRKFLQQTRHLAVINGDDENARQISSQVSCKKLFYGISSKNNYYVKDLSFDKLQHASFKVMYNGSEIIKIKLGIPGKHNVLNSLAAIIVCLSLGVPAEKIAQSIKNFTGVHRRFEILSEIKGITIADDFAHHPSEIAATLNVAKSMDFKRVIAVFQPHTFSRTFMFLDEFAKSLSLADKVILTDILPVRETNTYNIHSKDLAKKISNCTCVSTFADVVSFIKNEYRPGDLIITMGGGNIYECAHMIISELKK